MSQGKHSSYQSYQYTPPQNGNRSLACQPMAGEVRVRIEYCAIGNYYRAASKLDHALREEFNDLPVDVKLTQSAGGVYEVSVNGKLVFSKKATCRLPEDDEIFYHVRAALSSLSLLSCK